MTVDSNLISAHELLARIDDPNLRLLDCRFDLSDPKAGRRAYRDGHISGAVFADLDLDLSAPVSAQSGRHPLPAVNTLGDTFGRMGIDDATSVIVYDANDGALAARAWWLLRWLGHDRVRLLDGGIDHWGSFAGPVRKGEEQASLRSFVARPRHDRVLTTEELVREPGSIAKIRLIDARDSARFRGEVEPIDRVAGHIPGSRNLPYPVSLNDDGTWKAPELLEAIWLDVLGNDKSVPWCAMCGSGVTACHLAISGVEAGFREPRLYVGSWSEWIRDPERPVGLGQGPSRPSGAADIA